MKTINTLILDGKEVVINDERNLLELAGNNGVKIPTFCYHSELSVYGACRLCLVEIEGRGITTSCSTLPEAGMVVKTNTPEIRTMRKIALELLLANHDQSCPTCPKSATCKLQDLARQMGVTEVRFKQTEKCKPIDNSSPSLVRDPNKCILCGDCVRACREIQSVDAIDFAHRGSNVEILPALGKDLGQVECVHCGQCAAVCPTGALRPKIEISPVWAAIENPEKTVVAQIAPAVRVALGEYFGQPAGNVNTGKIVAALKAMGFDKVYDTCFTADLTVIEEAEEFIKRKIECKKLPQFTSCCPGWVRFAELYYPELLENLSSCKSPQQMFGSLAKSVLPKDLKTDRKDLVVVSIMPCTAKKAEARREEFMHDGKPDVDFVLTTQELGQMIEQAGLDFDGLAPESLDMPLGFKTGAGVIFGASGGVTEAVIRYAAEKLGKTRLENVNFTEVRGNQQLKEAELNIGDVNIKLAVVHGLRNARMIAEQARKGECPYDIVEVMACPGGCIGGAGQPVCNDVSIRKKRAASLYDIDKTLQLHKSQDNHMIAALYENELGEINGHRAHELLHTSYSSKQRMTPISMPLTGTPNNDAIKVKVCVGTNCFLKGSQQMLKKLVHFVDENNLIGMVDVSATFCLGKCAQSPNVAVDDEVISNCTFEIARDAILEKVKVLA